VLAADTAVLKTGSGASDWTYLWGSFEIGLVGFQRDQVATQIKDDLYNAEFNNVAIPAWHFDLARCEGALRAAERLAETAGRVG